MSFLDSFADDMRTLTKRSRSLTKNAIGETVESGTTDTPLKWVFVPIGSIGNDNKRISSHVLYTESTHILYFDHNTYTLTKTDRVLDEGGKIYEVKWVEEVPDFGGGIDHYTAFLSLKQ